MILNNGVLINNDGLHPAREEFQTVALKAGKQVIAIKYFQEGGSNLLKLLWQGPGIEKQEVPSSVLFH